MLKKIVASRSFEWFINLVILANCILIGVETYFSTPMIFIIQHCCLGIFIIEIVLRFCVRENTRSFLRNGWNIFDVSLVLVSCIPSWVLPHASIVLVLRILRAFRVLRLFKTCRELKLIIDVLVRSVRTFAINALVYVIFLYLFGIVGVECFRLPIQNEQTPPSIQEKLNLYKNLYPNAPTNSPDPYGSLHESILTLFRVMTGEDWTDIYYNLIAASKLKLIHIPCWFVVFYHVLWFCLSAFLLLNLVVGAVVNHYQPITLETPHGRRN